MIRSRVLILGLCLCGMAATASALPVTFTFSPNAWVNSYSTDVSQTRLQQSNPRLLIDGVASATDKVGSAGTHTTYAGASYSSTGLAGFVAGLEGLEIHDFNMWLADGINAPNWGEVLTQTAGTIPSGTATNGWAVQVGDNPWPQAGYGTKLVTWYDAGYYDDNPDTPANPLRYNGSSFGNFTLTVDLNAVDVYGRAVDLSAPQRVWLGTMLPLTWTADPDNLVYAGNHRFEGVMEMTAVPEPGTLALLGLGLAGAIRSRRRK